MEHREFQHGMKWIGLGLITMTYSCKRIFPFDSFAWNLSRFDYTGRLKLDRLALSLPLYPPPSPSKSISIGRRTTESPSYRGEIN